MHFALRENIHWCVSSGRAVFLDTFTDRYFCLPASTNDAFLRLATGDLQGGDEQKLDSLLRRGLLVIAADPQTISQAPLIETPVRDVPRSTAPISVTGMVVQMLSAEMWFAWLLRTKPFQKVLQATANVRTPPKYTLQSPGAALGAITSASVATSFIAAAHDRCLVRAFAAYTLSRRRGIGTRLVFGVVAHPFAAHCWVQYEDAVLVGGYEQAQLYTPILVLP